MGRRILKWSLVLLAGALLLSVIIPLTLLDVVVGGFTKPPSESSSYGVCQSTTDFSGNPSGFTPEQVTVLNTGVKVAYSHTELSPELRYKLAKIVIIVGLVESNARNLTYGHATSLGWLQQQDWWGTPAQRMDVATSTELFISGGAVLPRTFWGRPDGSESGVLDLDGWETMSAGEVAWRVQRPAKQYRGRYAERLDEAESFLWNGATPPSCDQKWTLPIEPGKFRITDRWGIKSWYRDYIPHRGTDLAAPEGTPVMAMRSGVVTFAADETTKSRYYGYYIIIDHGEIDGKHVITRYHTLGRIVPGLQGRTISGGETIGYVGRSGNSLGNHVHIEFQVDGMFVNPETYLLELSRKP